MALSIKPPHVRVRLWRAQQPMVSRAATIEARHIERAYINGDLMAQRRIEEYGNLEAEKWAALMAPFRSDPNPGSPILTFWNAGPLSTNGKNNSRPDDLPDESRCYDDLQEEEPTEESDPE